MAYRANPFLERMSERATSDQEFVRLFSPKILERLAEDAFEGAVHIFRSPPGAGKTTLLRAFTPAALHAFSWSAKRAEDQREAYHRLLGRGVLHEQEGPQLLGVLLSCAAGYADLPPAASAAHEGLFRALLDCRIVLRCLKSLPGLLSISPDQLSRIRLEYPEAERHFTAIPACESAGDLLAWAENSERGVYENLDLLGANREDRVPGHFRFEGVLWLQTVQFIYDGKRVSPKRLLMIDDLHKLRRKQRALLIEELTEMRPAIPIWLAERNIALGEELLSQGVREGRDLREYSLDEMWNNPRGQHQFVNYAQNILDRRLNMQDLIPAGRFAQYLRDQLQAGEINAELKKGIEIFRAEIQRHRNNVRYSEWLEKAERLTNENNFESLRELYVTRILVARDLQKRQLALELAPLSAEDFDERDSSPVQGAADIFMNNELKIPYYFGIERLCAMATSNIEELLMLAAALYEGLQAKQVLRRSELRLAPSEQEKLLRNAATRKRNFIPRSHTEGTRAQRLIDSIGSYCRERTFLPNAPYAAGVTGIRLSQGELLRLDPRSQAIVDETAILRKVLAECVAENLLVTRDSAASSNRESGKIFYLNRTLCTHFGLPLQMGGWQDVELVTLVQWMEQGRRPSEPRLLEA